MPVVNQSSDTSASSSEPGESVRRDPRWQRIAATLLERCDALALCTEEPGRITRTFCSAAMQEAHALVREWMTDAGMSVQLDAAGNLIGTYPASGRPTGSPALTGHTSRKVLIGSHLDTVADAGRYDGILGVLMGIAVVEALGETQAMLPWQVEVIGFSEEEGVRFQTPFIGSLALVGTLDEPLLARCDAAGVSVRDALAHFGCDPKAINQCAIASGSIVAFLEAHIEQGPVLEAHNEALGMVAAIAGQTRLTVQWQGEGGHAGTAPMALRNDPLPVAGRWIAAVEELGRATPGLVATVGRLNVDPNVPNCIPRRVTASLDVRHEDDGVRLAAVEKLLAMAEQLGREAQVTATISRQHEHAAVAMHATLASRLAAATERLGVPCRQMVSGAGHDAGVLAPVVPTAMLFLRSPGGVSHHPDEAVLPGDVALAIATLVEVIQDLAKDERTAVAS